jgi:hypothetical protein
LRKEAYVKFLCLAYYDEQKFDALSPDDVKALVNQCPAHDTVLRNSGRVLVQASLGEVRQGAVIRPRNGRPMVSDGPFAETKEQVGGFFIIEAQDREDAIRVASMHPAALLGEQVGWGIEVRPIEMFEQQQET